jgi:hypothetical protein
MDLQVNAEEIKYNLHVPLPECGTESWYKDS